MCGIAGFIDFTKKSGSADIKNMVATISHRGPDDVGIQVYYNKLATIGFGQSRLAIIDLSQGGHQPMRFMELQIVFNGEIYNYLEIRKELEILGHKFNSESDTEVILHAFKAWGIKGLDKFIGMFAFVIYDEKANKLIMIRDRAGVKPFYYFWNGNVFLFGSELKTFHTHNGFEKKINLKAIKQYFRQVHHGYVKAPMTVFENTFKLESGKYLEFDLSKKSFQIHTYWNVLDYYSKPKLKLDYQTAKEELKELLISACEYRMVSDVPVGVFLSGGYDSSAVAAIIQKNRTNRLKTFTIGFEEGNNEAPYAKATAKYLGTDHEDYICTTKEAQDIIPKLPFFFDEPFADSSSIPTILVSRLARKSVTVALSADAGDEIFCGYTSYFDLQNFIKKTNQIPVQLKPLFRQIGLFAAHLLPSSKEILKHKAMGFSKSLSANAVEEAFNLYQEMNNMPDSYKDLFVNKEVDLSAAEDFSLYKAVHNPIEAAMAYDYKYYLQDDILTKVDRATMSVSLEGREPFLDHRIIEFAAQLPFEYKLSVNGNGKLILRDIVHDYIPEEMLNRAKAGFSLPIYSWLKGDLYYLLDEYLSKEQIEKSGIFDYKFVELRLKEFKAGKLHYTTFIWKILMFQMWYSYWMTAQNRN